MIQLHHVSCEDEYSYKVVFSTPRISGSVFLSKKEYMENIKNLEEYVKNLIKSELL